MANEIWQRQEHDTDKSYEAFCVCRDMENRSNAKVGQVLGKTKNLIDRWSSAHNWVDRVRAYDDHQRELARIQYEEDKRKAKAERHRMIRAAKGKAAKKLDGLQTEDMSTAEFIRFLQMVLVEERNEFDDLPKQKTELGNIDGNALEIVVKYADS